MPETREPHQWDFSCSPQKYPSIYAGDAETKGRSFFKPGDTTLYNRAQHLNLDIRTSLFREIQVIKYLIKKYVKNIKNLILLLNLRRPPCRIR